MTVPEVAQLLRIGRAAVYEAIEAGQLRAARFGRVLRVRRADAWRWYDDQVPRSVSSGVDGRFGETMEEMEARFWARHVADQPAYLREERFMIRANRIARLMWGLP